MEVHEVEVLAPEPSVRDASAPLPQPIRSPTQPSGTSANGRETRWAGGARPPTRSPPQRKWVATR